MVVSYSISTSNHNLRKYISKVSELYLIPFLHQTTTPQLMLMLGICCILFHFYIKPQHGVGIPQRCPSCILFHFYIKPQLTSAPYAPMFVVSYSISTSNHNSTDRTNRANLVVSYSISTSNHNSYPFLKVNPWVVSYSISTSNHNHS